MKGVTKYEAQMEPHHHITCRNCSKIIDFNSDELIEYSFKIIKNVEDFDIDATSTNFYGICMNCKGE